MTIVTVVFCLFSDLAQSGVHYHHWLLRNRPTVARSTDRCAIDQSLRYRWIRRMRSAIGRWHSAIAQSCKSVISAHHVHRKNLSRVDDGIETVFFHHLNNRNH